MEESENKKDEEYAPILCAKATVKPCWANDAFQHSTRWTRIISTTIHNFTIFQGNFPKKFNFFMVSWKIYIHQNLHSPGFSILCPPFSIVRHQFLNPHILPFQTPFNEKPINCYRFHLSAINASCLLLTPWTVVMEKFCPVEKISDWMQKWTFYNRLIRILCIESPNMQRVISHTLIL